MTKILFYTLVGGNLGVFIICNGTFKTQYEMIQS